LLFSTALRGVSFKLRHVILLGKLCISVSVRV
jgi:hypothetical protein